MNGYTNPHHIEDYTFDHDFGAGSETFPIKGPSGKKGYIMDLDCMVYETFTDTTTDADTELGTTDGGAELVNLPMGTQADKTVLKASAVANAIVLRDIAADAISYLTLNAPTGGTPAGKAVVKVRIRWY